MSMQPTSNAAGRDGSALRMLKLFRDRPLLVGDVRTGTIPSLLPSQKHYLKVCSSFLPKAAWPVRFLCSGDISALRGEKGQIPSDQIQAITAEQIEITGRSPVAGLSARPMASRSDVTCVG
ncbi:MAG: hypothetical protein V1736_05325 [Pseudomonadota bacterium]